MSTSQRQKRWTKFLQNVWFLQLRLSSVTLTRTMHRQDLWRVENSSARNTLESWTLLATLVTFETNISQSCKRLQYIFQYSGLQNFCHCQPSEFLSAPPFPSKFSLETQQRWCSYRNQLQTHLSLFYGPPMVHKPQFGNCWPKASQKS